MNSIVQEAARIEGWMSHEELGWLALMAKKAKTIIEVGSWRGRSTKALALATSGCVYAVDHWLDSVNLQYIPGANQTSEIIWKAFQTNLAPEIAQGKVIPIRCNSKTATSQLEALKVPKADLIFIDADHSYEAVKKDVETYLPMLASGGVISGHDYSTNFPDVVRAINERFPRIKQYDTIWYLDT